MRLQKQKTREVKGKEYFRWSVVIPPKEVEEMGWKEGEELEPKHRGVRLVIEPERSDSKLPKS
jgi:bifunctional DNA-binding transcriptional regulator/antitoxin component of YhaV-PrlF toxin-antitoxin module